MMKKISFLVPCYNEHDNIEPMAEAITGIMEQYADKYDYEIIFRDNCSTDDSISVFRKIAAEDPHIKVILNARNYGVDPAKDTFVGRVSGDVIISIVADFQTPPELIPEFIGWWEKGYEVVCGQKAAVKEKGIVHWCRELFYSVMDRMSSHKQYRNMVGITLMSKRVYDLRADIDAPLRFFLSDLGCEIKLVQYTQNSRRSGKSSYNFDRYVSYAISSLIYSSTRPLRIVTLMGVFFSFFSFLIGLVYLILKIVLWNRFAAGIAPILIGIFFIGSVQILLIGILGEYIGNILVRVKRRPPPIVKELINFDVEDPYCIKGVADDNVDKLD